MKTIPMFFVIVIGLLASSFARCEDRKDDAKLIQGVWLPMSAELAGQTLPAEGIKDLKLTLTDQKYDLSTAQGNDRGTFTLDQSKNPKSMDIQGTEGPNKGKTFLAIYELTGDTLKICYDLTGKNRPNEYETKADSKRFLVVYKRGKP